MMSPIACRVVVGLAVLFATSAGCSSSSSPTSPSVSVSKPTETPTRLQLNGYVSDSAYRPLAGATVEVVSGPSAGMSTSVSASGEFSLTGDFDSTTMFRASVGGHVTATQPWTCAAATCSGSGARPYLAFYLAPLEPAVNIAGEYTLTFVADPACAGVPSELRSRTYNATILPATRRNEPAGSAFVMKVSGGTFVTNLDSFGIGVAGDYASFFLDGGHDAPVVEQVSSNSFLAFSGGAAAQAPSTTTPSVSMMFDGWIEYCLVNAPTALYSQCPVPAVNNVYCESKNHQMILARR